jgi:hypothetical protein
MNTDTFIAALAILVIGYIIYKSFFADKETVLETINETKKEVETVVATAPPLSAAEQEIIAEVAKKVTRKPRTPKVAAAEKVKKTKVKKNG